METWRDRLIILQRLYNLRNEPGTRLMELIYTVYSPVRENFVVEKVLACCGGVLSRSISRWMSGFELDQCDLQMIASCPQRGYRLVWIPPFFPRWIAEYILKTGKSWRSVDVRKSSENLDKARAIVASQLDSKCLYLPSERHRLEYVVREACGLVCGSVVRSFVEEPTFVGSLNAAHCFFLLHDPQFSLSLYRQFCECTHGLRSKLSQRDASNALIAAAASSKTAQRFSFPFNLEALSSINDTPNTSSRLQYESLFHFVWPVEMSLFMISEHASAFGQTAARMSRATTNDSVKALRLTSALLSFCERILLRIRIYIAEVVDQFFKRLRIWIDDAIDLDAVVEAHNKYLDGLSAAFFMNNETEVTF
ncbi:hypothetical protein COOONC_17119 [Cooperia oncophora]